MTHDLDSTLHRDKPSASYSTAAPVALSSAEAGTCLQALKAKLSTALSKHCASVKTVNEAKELYKVTNDMNRVVQQTITGFWAGHRSTHRETEPSGSVSSALDPTGPCPAGSVPLDFSLNRIASDHATYLVGQALDEVLSEVQASTTQMDQKRLRAKCDASIGDALNRFHRESHRFAEVPAYSGTAREYRRDIVTCRDMLWDETALRSVAREAYLRETKAKVDEAELTYDWVDKPGSKLTCVMKTSTTEDDSPGSFTRGMTPDSFLADDGRSSEEEEEDGCKAWEQRMHERTKHMSDMELLMTVARLFSEGDEP